jgi:hypothetical protein
MKPFERAIRACSAVLAVATVAALLACCGDSQSTSAVTVSMDFTRASGFYAAPHPSTDLQDENGYLDLSAFPNPTQVRLFDQAIELGEEDVDGAGVNSAVFFQLTGPIDPEGLPRLHESVDPASAVFLINVTRDSSGYLRRVPIYSHFSHDGGMYGAPNLLALLPLQGVPLRPHTRYAAVVTRRLHDLEGLNIRPSSSMGLLRSGQLPAGLQPTAGAAYLEALAALSEAGVDSEDIAGLAVFRTADPARQTRAVRDDMLAGPLPQPNAPFVLQEVFDEYCTYRSTIDMPVYQEGDPPYTTTGGRWVFDAGGSPVVRAHEEATFWITLPRQAVPASGFPVAVFIRTGGGGDRPLIDRGTRAEPFGDPIEPGTGPALFFARAGFAGVSVDGPHGGLRNVTGGDEQFLMFTLSNPAALRDNIRQSAVEIVLLAHLLDMITVDATGCPGVTGPNIDAVTFDLEHLSLMGHSMGATIAPLVLQLEPRYRAVILSGAGASWIENLVYKQSPMVVRDVAELLLGYEPGTLHRLDPALSILQWAADSADPLSALRGIVSEPGAGGPVHVLMLQGIVDTYILPSIANAMSLGLGLDLAGPSLDAGHPDLTEFAPLESLLRFAGAQAIALPVEGNQTGANGDPVTAVVLQHPEDGIEDGHEVVFQSALPKYQYQCFLKTFRQTGLPYVPAQTGDLRCQ